MLDVRVTLVDSIRSEIYEARVDSLECDMQHDDEAGHHMPVDVAMQHPYTRVVRHEPQLRPALRWYGHCVSHDPAVVVQPLCCRVVGCGNQPKRLSVQVERMLARVSVEYGDVDYGLVWDDVVACCVASDDGGGLGGCLPRAG